MVHMSNNPLDVLCIKYECNIQNTYAHRNKYITVLAHTLPYITFGQYICEGAKRLMVHID